MSPRAPRLVCASHPKEVDHMHRFSRPSRLALVALAGGAAALTVASMTNAASESTETTQTSTTATTTTATTKTTATTTTAAKKKAAAKKKIVCRARLVGVLPAGTSVGNYGTLSCTGASFGEGVQHDNAQLARASDTAGSLTGRLKLS